MSSTSTSGRPASRGGLLITLLTMLSLGIQQPAAAQDIDLRSLRNPLQGPREQSPPEMDHVDHVPSDVRDTAGMFSADAVRAARDALAKIERTIGVPVLIETVETLKGETIDEVATRLARRSGAQGVFILIAQGVEDRGAGFSPLHRGVAAPGAHQGSLGIHRGVPQEEL